MPEPAHPESSLVCLQIGTISLALSCTDPLHAEQIRRQYQDYLTNAVPGFLAEVRVDQAAHAASLIDAPFGFRDGLLVCGAGGEAARVDAHSRRGELTVQPARAMEQVEYYLRMATALLAYEAGGLLFHAAAVVRGGRGYLFFGPSGSGKSTIARLSPGDTVLNDDLVLLMPELQGWAVFATPFWNRAASKPAVDRAPVYRLFRLAQDRTVSLEELPASLGVAELLASIPVVTADPGRTAGLVDRCQVILESIPAYRLHFLPDASFWPAVEAS